MKLLSTSLLVPVLLPWLSELCLSPLRKRRNAKNVSEFPKLAKMITPQGRAQVVLARLQ